MAGIKALRRTRTDDKAVQNLQDHAEQLDQVSILNGQLVSAVFPASLPAGYIVIRHSLGRSYRGAFLVGVDAVPGSTFPPYVPVGPATAAAVAVDPKTHLVVTATTVPLSDQTVSLWVF